MTRFETSHDGASVATSNKGTGTPLGQDAVIALQRLGGNAATTSFLQRRGGVSSPARTGGGSKSKSKGPKGQTGGKGKAAVWTANEISALVKGSSEKVFQAIADRDTRNGVTLVTSAVGWDAIIAALPGNGSMVQATQDAIPKILGTKLLGFPQMSALFTKRFDRILSTAGDAALTTDGIIMVWKQLDRLPAADVTETTTMAVIHFIAGGGGFYMGKWPGGAGRVEMGLEASQDHIEHTVRHEIGHGVHAQLENVVDHWLQHDIGMWWGNLDEEGVDELIAEFGGWPATYSDAAGVQRPFGPSQRQVVRESLQQYTNSRQWDPGVMQNITPSRRAALFGVPGVAETINESPAYWYNNYANYHRAASGRRVFLNHWYHKWFWMSDRAKAIVDISGDSYTAMSEKELFANAYAEYFKDPGGKKDPTKWGGSLPGDVKEFFKDNVVDRQPYTKMAKREKKTNR